MKLFYNIGAFLLNKIEEVEERRLKKKYPNWNPNDWIGDLEFIWGVKSYDCLACCNANIHKLKCTQNELEDALHLEIDICEIRDTKFGKRLLKSVRKRRRIVNGVVKKADKEIL